MVNMKKLIKKAEKMETNDLAKMLTDVENKLNEIFGKKAPKMPESVVDFLVKYGPYLIIVGLILTVLTVFQTIGWTSRLAPMNRWGGYNYGFGPKFWLMEILMLVPAAMQAMAVSPLMKRQIKGWRLMFWASLVSVVIGVLRLELGGTLVGAIISWYILFQIRKEYK